MSETIIRVENLKKNYGSTRAVDGISFDIERGTLFSILGPNGAGKTTTLECMEGLLKPDAGNIELGAARPGIQLQSSALPEHLRVSEALRLFCAYRRLPYCPELLERFGLAEKMKTEYCKLSTGQKRRLTLALAVFHRPEVLFLDEPTAGLDVQSRTELHRIIRELRTGGTTIILATHDMAEAENLSDRIIILSSGKIAAEGSPAEITAAGSSLSRISVKTEQDSLLTRGSPISGAERLSRKDDYIVLFSRDIEDSITDILHRVRNSGDRMVDLRVERPSLEERFVEITGNARNEGARV